MAEWRVSFGDLRVGSTARRYLERALKKNWVSQGDNVVEFERRFAEKFGYKHAIATSCGTDADICACASLYDFGARRSDEIIVPALCFVACANSILAAGFTPKFVDIELETLNLDPEKVRNAINMRTKGIMAVHTMGKMCDMDKLTQIARAYDLKIIEDACEAHGAQYRGKIVGSIGSMGTFSFYCAHLIVSGEGGMVVTNDDKIADVLRSIRTHGRPTGNLYFDFQRIGFNSRMNDMEAAIGLEGLGNFDDTFRKRKYNLNRLLELTPDLSDYCYFLKEEFHEVVSPHAFPLVLKYGRYGRDRLYSYLEERGIQCKTLFGSLPTQHKAFRFLGYRLGDFPVAEYVGENGLHFGIHQYLNEDDLIYVSKTLQEYFRKYA